MEKEILVITSKRLGIKPNQIDFQSKFNQFGPQIGWPGILYMIYSQFNDISLNLKINTLELVKKY